MNKLRVLTGVELIHQLQRRKFTAGADDGDPGTKSSMHGLRSSHFRPLRVGSGWRSAALARGLPTMRCVWSVDRRIFAHLFLTSSQYLLLTRLPQVRQKH